MKETIYCSTCALQLGTLMTLAERIRKWLPNASVYVQMNPKRIVVCRDSTCTVINEGDVFSFVQRYDGKQNDIINHSEKQDTVRVSIGDRDFLIETFVAYECDGTENMKYRLTDLTYPDLSKDFDFYTALKEELNSILWKVVDRRLMTI